MSKDNIFISVTNKTGLEKFSQVQKAGWPLISTGGTLKALGQHGIKCMSVEEITGFPEMMDGRLKTLHPKIHGGILADRSKTKHLEKAREYGISLIDVVVVNLYDFKGKPSIENIDIGGPTLIRGAAKNAASVTVVVDPDDYDRVIEDLMTYGMTSVQFREELMHKAFAHTALYDAAIAEWMHRERKKGRPIISAA